MAKSFEWTREAAMEWDARSLVWDAKSQNMWENGSRKKIVPFMKKHVPAGGKILDIGCGSGYGTYKLHEAGFQAEGIDISKEMVALAIKHFNRENIDFHSGDMKQLPFSSEAYDGMMAINVFEWTDNPSVALNEMKRILKKDGFICAGILGPAAGPRAHGYRKVYGEDTIINSMMPWEFSQLAKENGFFLVDSFGVYKKGVNEKVAKQFSSQLQQSLSFMWIFMLQKKE